MQREDFRLELLKLTYVHGRTAAEAVGAAQVLEAYVFESVGTQVEDQPEATSKSTKPSKKKSGNSDILS